MMPAKDDLEQLKEAFSMAFATDYGKKVLAYLMVFAKFNSHPYCSDPAKASYLEGRRSVVSEIIDLCNGGGDE